MKNPFSELPIVRDINPHTGLLEGDDSGYRKVPVTSLDSENPDPMVVLTEVATRPLYALGATPGLCTYYPTGLGGPSTVLVRAPIARGLIEADQILTAYNRKVLVVDGWRPWWVQAALWTYLRADIIKAEGLTDGELSIYDEVRIGCKADDVGSYCAVLENDEFQTAKEQLINGEQGEELAQAAEKLGKSIDDTATLFLTFGANLKRNGLSVQEDAVTAHGNGGAVDLWTIDATTGKFSNLGVPFDFVPRPGIAISPAVINYFDMPEITPEVYAAEVAQDPTLQRYLRELGYETATQEVFYEAQIERRILFHTMMQLGGSYFSLDKDLGEPWHFQLGNERGGNQALGALLGSGNGCHAKLKGIEEAVWSNSVGHKLARELLTA